MQRRRGRTVAAVTAVGVGLVIVAWTPAQSVGIGPRPHHGVDARTVTHPAAARRTSSVVAGAGAAEAPPEAPAAAAVPAAAAATPVALPLPVAQPAVVATTRTSWGPSLETLAEARAVVESMPLERLAGQVLVVQYGGTDPGQAAATVANWHLGGVILMADNIASADQVRASTAAFHAAVASDGRSWPAVVGVDEEGGRVSRLRGVVPDLPPFATFGAAGDDAATRARFAQLGADLTALGVTMDFAPVADVTIGPADPTIGDRSPSSDPTVAQRTVLAAAAGLTSGGVVPVVKHFPGHGSVTVDSHAALPVQPATVPQLAARDLVPFAAAVDAGVPAVMLAHLDVPALEPGVPASLSPAAYRLLRDDLGFEGVAVTDALNMAAVPESAPGEVAVRALAAGADLLLMPRDAGAAVTAIAAAVRDGRVPLERLQEAATRVIALQMWTAAMRGAA